MPRAHPIDLRQEIVTRHCQGESLPSIASDLGMSYSTVRSLWRRYRDEGTAGLSPQYHRCGKHGSDFSPVIAEAVLFLARDQPAWPAGYILAYLHDQFPCEPLPSLRTLQRWLKSVDTTRSAQAESPVLG
jgi:hypothetical protein